MRSPTAADAVVIPHNSSASADDGARNHAPHHLPQVLFVCVHNAGRSQMAAALLEHHAAGRVEVRSAGSTPVGEINPAVRDAMAEIGIDLDGAHPKLRSCCCGRAGPNRAVLRRPA